MASSVQGYPIVSCLVVCLIRSSMRVLIAMCCGVYSCVDDSGTCGCF